jgi:hypothetical protein
MYETHHHTVNVIGFTSTDYKTTFVKVEGYDAILEKEFEGEVKFVDGMPFGDIIHPQRSSLSSSCRQHVRAFLLIKYNNGDFR